MSFFERPALEFTTGPHPEATIIWLHGLGADGADFAVFAETLAGVSPSPLRFVFPHAPVRAVALNAGLSMPAWFDLYGTRPEDPQDEIGIRRALEAVSGLITHESRRGIPPERIVLGGFSQGGAIALHTALTGPSRLAAAVGLSTYLPLANRLAEDLPAANRGTPVFLAHGTEDLTLPYAFAVKTLAVLKHAGVPATLHTYEGLGHGVCDREVEALARFLTGVFSAGALGAGATSV